MKDKLKYIVITVMSCFVGVAGTIIVYHYCPPKWTTETIEKTVSQVSVTESDTIQSGVSKIYDAVVVVESYSKGQLSSSGTGFVYKKDNDKAYIITNCHVVSGASSVKIVNMNNESVEAKVLGSDEYEDVAVLQIDANYALAVSEIGKSDDMKLGDTVFTVGTPVGSEYMGTVTKGILSGKDRKVTVSLGNGSYVMNVMQTDAAINPGNSGGPLCNINGQVIGVNSLKLVKDTIEGMGFALPIELVMTSVDRLEKGEEIVRPVLGVETVELSNSYTLYRYQIYVDEEVEQGVVVVNVVKNSPAANAGLKKGDVILEIAGTKIEDGAHLKYVLYKYTVGDTITIKYYRDGKIQDATVKLSKAVGEI